MQLTLIFIKARAAFANISRWLFRGALAWITFKRGSRPVRIILKMVLPVRDWVYARPKVKNGLAFIFDHTPLIKNWFRKLNSTYPRELSQLNPRALRIYADLKEAIEKNKRKRY